MMSEKVKNQTRTKEGFNSVKYFRAIKEKLAERMYDMSLKEQKEFMKKIKEGKVNID